MMCLHALALVLLCWCSCGSAFMASECSTLTVRSGGRNAVLSLSCQGLHPADIPAQQSRRKILQWLAAGSAIFPPQGVTPVSAETYRVQKSEEEWAKILSDQQRFVLREGGTEAPSSSPLVLENRPGEYRCAGCSNTLFSSAAKFEARTGWPSFADTLPNKVVVAKVSPIVETISGAECRCASCGGRIGERFLDGTSFPGTPALRSGKRYSMNGAALVFLPADGSEEVSGEAEGSFMKRRKFDWKMRDGGLRSI